MFVQSTPYTGLKTGVLNVLTALSKSVAFKIFFSKHGKLRVAVLP